MKALSAQDKVSALSLCLFTVAHLVDHAARLFGKTLDSCDTQCRRQDNWFGDSEKAVARITEQEWSGSQMQTFLDEYKFSIDTGDNHPPCTGDSNGTLGAW